MNRQSDRIYRDLVDANLVMRSVPKPINERKMTLNDLTLKDSRAEPHAQHRFRVELLVNTRSQPSETILIREVIADAERDAAALAIQSIKKEFPTVAWLNIDLWYLEEIE